MGHPITETCDGRDQEVMNVTSKAQIPDVPHEVTSSTSKRPLPPSAAGTPSAAQRPRYHINALERGDIPLDPTVFSNVCSRLEFTPRVDVFASSATTSCPPGLDQAQLKVQTHSVLRGIQHRFGIQPTMESTPVCCLFVTVPKVF